MILAGNDLGKYIWGYFREKQDVFQKCKDFRVVIKLLTPAKMKIVQNLIKKSRKSPNYLVARNYNFWHMDNIFVSKKIERW